ncbi:hypothetical protein CIHG_02556 [Coccidioides immitis H538.4]|uniref:Uncharacterized protein n=1 Tax=Coccidioides immitis H538.4 TaxID=396776 RepID=A0A0J8RIV2_COCIT|nr:hypothetical protein CIHG_02556 [Coccidioides immitis H538.4]
MYGAYETERNVLFAGSERIRGSWRQAVAAMRTRGRLRHRQRRSNSISIGRVCLRRRAAPDMQLQPAAASLGATMFLPGAAQRRMDRIQAEIIIKRFSCRLATG